MSNLVGGCKASAQPVWLHLAFLAYEAGFVSAAHGATEIDATLAAAREAFKT